jgi:hypothetical protein
MKAPRTRIAEANNEFERDLLRSWESERPSDRALPAALGIVAAGATLGASASASAASAAAVAGSVGGSIAPKGLSLGVLAAGKWLAMGAVAAAVAGGTFAYERSPAKKPPTTVAPFTATATPRTVTVSGPRESFPTAHTPVEPVAAQSASQAPLPPTPGTTTSVPTRPELPSADGKRGALGLGEQVAMLGLAHDALADGDPAGAIRFVDDYDRQFPQGLLAQESTALRIEALVKQGALDSAGQLGDRCMSANPASPLAAKVRRLLARDDP